MAIRQRRAKGLTFLDACELAAELPGVEQGTSYGTPAIKVRGKFMARLKEDGETLVLRVSFDVRDHLLAAAPSAFYITDHYRGYPAILARLAVADPAVIQQLLEDAWRAAAPKRVVQQYNARTATTSRQGGAS